MAEEMEAVPSESWTCIDDGTGRNVLYISSTGERRRKEPPNYQPECFVGGRRRYYYRGACIRCKKKGPQIVLSIGPGAATFSVNYCEDCLLVVTPGISRIRNNGNKIWQAVEDVPMAAYFETEAKLLDPNKHMRLVEVSKLAQYNIAMTAKARRNAYRYNRILNLRDQYGIKAGEHVSWGFDNNAFDEYFGELNAARQPHGEGVRFYSDGSVYCGGFVNGQPHCDAAGVLKRPNGAEYEGSWVNGLKHGSGTQRHPDGSVYVGEFAKGFEHGTGELTRKDGSLFQGKFRYGRKDGPGVLITPDGVKTKGVFREAEGYNEKPPPLIHEDIVDDDTLGQPLPLSELAIAALSTVMHTHRQIYPSKRISKRLFAFLKPTVTKKYMEYIVPSGAPEFASIMENAAMMNLESLRFENMKLISTDIETLVYFESSNPNLSELVIRSSKIRPYGIDLIAQHIERGIWPKLCTLDMSLNVIEYTTMQTLTEALSSQPLESLILSCCGIKANSAQLLSQLLQCNDAITNLDLSFNAVNVEGAEALAAALIENETLLHLNLRGNNIQSSGGLALVEALKTNYSLKSCVVADNKIGSEIATQIAARIHGSVVHLADSFKSGNIKLPKYYERGRFASKHHS